MSDLKIKAWVFIDFGVDLWKNPEEARSLARWEVIHDQNEAFNIADGLGMNGLSLLDTSPNRTKRMFAVFESELEEIEDWDHYAREYVDNLTTGLQNLTARSGCGCGMLTGGCGCSPSDEAGGAGCACGSSESCSCKGE